MCYAKLKELDSKGNILSESIYMTFWERPIDRAGGEISGRQRQRIRGRSDFKGVAHSAFLEGNKTVLYPEWLHDYTYLSDLRELFTKKLILPYGNLKLI